MKKDIKVKVVLSEGYEERFTKACIKVAIPMWQQYPQRTSHMC